MTAFVSALPGCATFTALLPWADLQYAIVEAPWEVRFLALPAGPEFLPEGYPSGRLFGDLAEVRWRKRRNGLFHVVLIHDEGVALNGAKPEALQPGEPDPSRFLLWKESGEPRIPKPIQYPGGPYDRDLAVTVKRYRLAAAKDSEMPAAVLTRYRGLQFA
jgi:hypothetical protein